MPRSFVVLLLVLARHRGRDLLLSSRAGEVPTRTIEVDVTNAAGR